MAQLSEKARLIVVDLSWRVALLSLLSLAFGLWALFGSGAAALLFPLLAGLIPGYVAGYLLTSEEVSTVVQALALSVAGLFIVGGLVAEIFAASPTGFGTLLSDEVLFESGPAGRFGAGVGAGVIGTIVSRISYGIFFGDLNPKSENEARERCKEVVKRINIGAVVLTFFGLIALFVIGFFWLLYYMVVWFG